MRPCSLAVLLLVLSCRAEGEDGWLVAQLFESTSCGGPVLEESGRPVKLSLCVASPCHPVLGSSYSFSSPAVGRRLVCSASAPVAPSLVNRVYQFGSSFSAYPRGCTTFDGGRRSFNLRCSDANASRPHSGYTATRVFYSDATCTTAVSDKTIVSAEAARDWTVFCAPAVRPLVALWLLALAGLLLG